MTLREFLRKKTEVKELCVIRDCGYIIASCWIDYEDLFHIPPRLADKEITNDEWGCLTIVNKNNAELTIPCHYVDV